MLKMRLWSYSQGAIHIHAVIYKLVPIFGNLSASDRTPDQPSFESPEFMECTYILVINNISWFHIHVLQIIVKKSNLSDLEQFPHLYWYV